MSKSGDLVRIELFVSREKLNELFKNVIDSSILAGLEEEKPANPVPVATIFELYKSHCPELTQHKILTSAMQTSIRARFHWVMKNKSFTDPADGIAWFKSFFSLVNQNDFLCGRKNEHRKWKADLVWLMNETNFDKILSGKY